MPTYEYRCTKCGEHIEVYQSFTDEPLKKHDVCGGKLNKVLGSVGIVFKGSGFYRTDNRGGPKRAKEGTKESAESSSSSDSKTDSSKSGSKSDGSKSGSSGSGTKDSGSTTSKKSTEAKSA